MERIPKSINTIFIIQPWGELWAPRWLVVFEKTEYPSKLKIGKKVDTAMNNTYIPTDMIMLMGTYPFYISIESLS
jgi:hypothetical protein